MMPGRFADGDTRRRAGGAPAGRVHVIGGNLRGSRLSVAKLTGLRPTPQRLRQTLFDWLAPAIEGARVLDAFAGTGALGIEALSRGAGEVLFLERDAVQAASIGADLARLDQAGGTVRCVDALRWLASETMRPFSIVLLDPPFEAALWARAADLLIARGWLADRAWVYVEANRPDALVPPAGWRLHRRTHAGAVWGALYRVEIAVDD